MSAAYIDYIESVLGVKNPIWPSFPQSVEKEAVADSPALSVLFLAEHSWTPAETALFEKMREAMKIPAEKVKCLFADQASVPQLQMESLSAERVVCFSERLYNQISVESVSKFLASGPDILLKSPALKKETWAQLQKVMKSLGLV